MQSYTLLAFVALFGMQTIKAAERFVNFNQGDLLLNPQKQVTITTDEADFMVCIPKRATKANNVVLMI